MRCDGRTLVLGLSVLVLAAPVWADDEDGLPSGPQISNYGRSLEGRGDDSQGSTAAATASAGEDRSGETTENTPVATRQGAYGSTALLGHYLNGEELGDPGLVPLSQRGSIGGDSLLDPESESGFALDPTDFEGEYSPEEMGQDPEEWTWLDTAQATLDGAGVIDPTGVVDLFNGLVYFGRGKPTDGFIAMAGIIPYIGDTAKLGKYGAKGVKAAAAGGEAIAKATTKFAARKGAFRAARRDMGIPISQRPFKVKTGKDAPMLRDLDGNIVSGSNGQPLRAREYYFRRQSDGKVFAVQEHSLGHASKSGVGNQAPHFNVRPVDPATGQVLNKTPAGFQPHYSWGSTP